MSLLLNNLRYTVSRIFDLYSLAPFKKLYATSLVYFLWVNLFFSILAIGVVYPLSLLFPFAILPSFFGEGTVLRFIGSQQVLGLIQSLIILGIGVFGVVLLRCKEEGVPPRANFLDVIGHITNAERKIVGWCVLVVVALHVLLFNDPFAPNPSEVLVYDITTTGTLFELLTLFKNSLLPCFLSMIIVLYSMRGKGKINLSIMREYRLAYLSSLLLLLGLNTVQRAAVHLVYEVIAQPSILIAGMFLEPPISVDGVLLGTIVGIVYGTIFLAALGTFAPALSAALVLPFHGEEERLRNREGSEAEDIVEDLQSDVSTGTDV